MQGQERVRKTSLDLRREIIDVGGIQNLIELRKKRKQKKRDALAAAQEPPPEPEEIVRVLGRINVGRGSLGSPEAPYYSLRVDALAADRPCGRGDIPESRSGGKNESH